MFVSKVTRLPDLSRLDIPEKQRVITVRDEQIFADLRNRHRTMADREGGACIDDYVLVDLKNAQGAVRTLHAELGAKAFKAYETALIGCKAGQEIPLTLNGETVLLKVRSVRMPVELPLTDDAIAALQMPGIKTLHDYRLAYLKEHDTEIADRVFRALQARLIDQALAMTEMELDRRDTDRFNEQQLTMLKNIQGDADARILKAYGEDGKNSLEECYRLFYEDNARTCRVIILGKAMAEHDGAVPTEEEYRQFTEYFCLVFNKTTEQVEKENLREDVLQSYWLQYVIGQIKSYYRSIVRFDAVGIERMPLNK